MTRSDEELEIPFGFTLPLSMSSQRPSGVLRSQASSTKEPAIASSTRFATQTGNSTRGLALDFVFARVYLRYENFPYTFQAVPGGRTRSPRRMVENLPQERAQCHEADVCRSSLR
jgi:hypothetical protein